MSARDVPAPPLHAAPAPPPPRTAARTATGPASGVLSVPPNVTGLFDSATADTTACPTTGRTCWAERASTAAAQGRYAAAAAACIAITEPKWCAECALMAAETGANRAATGEYTALASLCLLVTSLEGRCVDRVHARLALAAPGANAPSAEWRATRQLGDEVRATWQDLHPPLADTAVAGFWIAHLHQAYQAVPSPNGAPINALPDTAVRHIHTAAARAFVARAPTHHATFARWRDAFDRAMADRSTAPRPAQPARPSTVDHAPTRWVNDRPGDGDIPATLFQIGDRRPTSADISTDRALGLIASLGRQSPLPTTVLTEAAADPDPTIARAAQRMLDWR